MSLRRLISIAMALALAALAGAALADTGGSPSHEGTKAGALVELALKGFGGAEAVSASTSISAYGNAEDPVTGKPGTYSHYITYDGAGSEGAGDFRMDLTFGGRSQARSRSGLSSYSSSDGGRLSRVEDEDDWRVYFEQKSLALPFLLMRGDQRPDYSGMGFIDGKRYEKLALYDPAGPALLVVMDGKTGQVNRTFMDTGQGKEGIFEMRFSDYAPEGELILPHSFSEYVGGRKVLEVKLRDFTFNTVISPNLFRP